MSHGPILLYDKSALQALNADEAFWLGMHYRTNLCPLFYVEVLADLDKPARDGRSADDAVRTIARKLAPMGVHPNVYHMELVLGELLGQRVEMVGVPIQAGARRVNSFDGRSGIAFDVPSEVAAFNRWKRGDFAGVERDFARRWREMLGNLDVGSMIRNIFGEGRPSFSDLTAIKRRVDWALDPKNGRFRFLRFALEQLRIPPAYRSFIFDRWKARGGEPFRTFAPYSHFVLTVDVFFNLAVAAGHIAATRSSNRVDMAYLYYLPFCMAFASGDNLHARVAPLFLREDQEFIPARTLKADLAQLVTYYSGLPEEVKSSGAIRYAAYPPLEGEYLTCKLFDRFLPGWRVQAANPIQITPELEAAILKRVRPMMESFEKAEAELADDTLGSDNGTDRILKMSVHNDSNRWRLF
jgi:hypothetical protein